MALDINRKLLTSLTVMGSLVEARDPYTGGHLWRVSRFSRLIADKIGLDREEVFLAGLGGFLHDLGKVGVPDAILNKAGPLTDAEYDVIKTHPGIGATVLSDHPLAPLAIDAVVTHHERPDGKGYPASLTEERIPLVGRIVAIADAFDAMTSSRPYRRGMPVAKAVEILASERGRQFDSALTDAFLAIAGSGGVLHVVGHGFDGARMADCPMCGPIIPTHDLSDGQVIGCRGCGGIHRLHRKGDGWQVEAVAPTASADMLAPRPDFAPIADLVAAAPTGGGVARRWFGKLFG